MRTRGPGILALGIVLASVFLLAGPILAQNPSGQLIGRVEDQSGAALPGVTVTATSPALQGTRSAQTDSNGNYKIPFLPPGDYRTTYELEGFATSVRTVRVSAAQTQISDITMQLSEVVEEILVTSNMETISETSTVAQTYTQDEIEKLAIARTPLEAINLAPGVANTGPSTEPSIHGAMSFENLYLVNGVVVNENIRGQFLPLFIEDAIQETTVGTAGVSAEYGRFTGGVVNVITRSGGNEFEGSFRTSFENEDWESADVRQEFNPAFEPEDNVNETFEATFGGPIWRDRIWFFLAGRDRELSETGFTSVTSISFPVTDEEERIEGKLTLGITPSHSLIGTYLEIDRVRAGSTFGTILDLDSVANRTDPQEMKSVNYTGILTPSFFVEAQYSERDFEIATGFGGVPDLIEGTLMRHRPTGRRFHSPTFCGSCEPEVRNNEDYLAKASYFLTTTGAGTHDITFGYDNFSDIRFSVNHQSGSDFQVWAEDIVIGANNEIFPIFRGPTTWLVWWPPVGLDIAAPTDFETRSFFVNDSWQLSENWSFNLGARYDENHGVDSSGALVSDDNKISPRLGMTYDIKGDGDLVFNASYGTYVAALANSGNVADAASTGGALAGFFFVYTGPQVNATCRTNPQTCVTTEQALDVLFNQWYFPNGGVDQLAPVPGETLQGSILQQTGALFYSTIPGATTVIREALKSPSADEITVGVTKRLGAKGLFRADVVYREWEDFYSERTNLGDVAFGSDVIEVGNFGDSFLEREYLGLDLSARYRITDRLTLAGNYTLSELEGNINGETGGSGPVPASPNTFPEYADVAWSFPVGRLNADQTHKLRAWAVFDIVDNEHHNLNVSVLQNFFSGSPYGAVGAVDSRPFVTNPGYAQPPATVTYFFTDRDAFETDDITRTDLALNYSFRFNLFGKGVEVFLQPEVLNVFDEDAIADVYGIDTTVFDATNTGPTSCNGAPCQTFNPFTETPVQGVHWALGEDFGEADSALDIQNPRTFRFSVGFRF